MKQGEVPKLIAFHLPQFHPIPENDEWWGTGFTEWTNVVKAKPLFKDHYQPHLPADLGFYDLRLAEARDAQAALASKYGVYGFCYYHYWFNGRRLLERPVNEVCAFGKPEFPFCLCWANENWTRVWDGGAHEILMQQAYSERDDLEHIRSLLPIFQDRRYIAVDGKPLFLVYRASRIPNPRLTTDNWRREVSKVGFPGLFLVRVESFDEMGDPSDLGFDAALEFQPRMNLIRGTRAAGQNWWERRKLRTLKPAFAANSIYDYDVLVERALTMKLPDYPYIRCVCPGFDNSARRKKHALILRGSTPEAYERWLRTAIHQTSTGVGHAGNQQNIVFINAWNEWAEGNHLEPCQKWGHAYLEATLRALFNGS